MCVCLRDTIRVNMTFQQELKIEKDQLKGSVSQIKNGKTTQLFSSYACLGFVLLSPG